MSKITPFPEPSPRFQKVPIEFAESKQEEIPVQNLALTIPTSNGQITIVMSSGPKDQEQGPDWSRN